MIYLIYEMAGLIVREEKRQKKVINLIASENYPSEKVRKALSSLLVSKYAEGYPGKRYYAGNEIIDEIEHTTQANVLKMFDLSPKKWAVNVQPYSGSIANLATYTGALERGAKIMAMSLSHGGHLTHGHPVSLTSKLFDFTHYGVNEKGFLDYDALLAQARQEKPAMIVCGATAYPRSIDFKKMKKIADDIGALLMADISHIVGLVVSGVHPSPFPYADIVTSTTHKTLRGPRGAFIVSKIRQIQKNEKQLFLNGAIDRAIFPGLQGGPHMHTIAGIGIACEEAKTPHFIRYGEQIIANARALASSLIDCGFTLVSGGTDTHLILVDLRPLDMSGARATEILEEKGIIVNKNSIPFDDQKPDNPSGIRLGVAGVTIQGMKEKDMSLIAKKIKKALF